MPDKRTLHRATYFPCQLPDGSTHVIGPGDRIVMTIDGEPDGTRRWTKAKSYAEELNRRHSTHRSEVKVRQRWAVIILALVPVVIDVASGGALSREIVSWIMG